MRKLLVSFFGLGYGPMAPGTWGSGGALAVFLLLFFTVGAPWWLLAVLIAAACAVCVALGGWAVKFYASPDPKPVVIDEVAGMWLSLLLVPQDRIAWMLPMAFILFRVFDIVKLPPARQAERLPAGWGILCDDLVAGIQANVLLQVTFRLLWSS